MKDLFVPYEIANKIKELGFDEFCIGHYSYSKKLLFSDYIGAYNYKDIVPAPIYQQVIDWFDKNHNITIDSYAEYDNYGCEVCVRSKFGWLDGIDMDLKGYKTRNEAVNQGILTALSMIEDNTKKK